MPFFYVSFGLLSKKISTFAAKFIKMKILITGASGFIGSFIVEEALKRGFDTWAAIRKSSSREWLQDERIHFIELHLSSSNYEVRHSTMWCMPLV